jgi:hypothetical protein
LEDSLDNIKVAKEIQITNSQQSSQHLNCSADQIVQESPIKEEIKEDIKEEQNDVSKLEKFTFGRVASEKKLETIKPTPDFKRKKSVDENSNTSNVNIKPNKINLEEENKKKREQKINQLNEIKKKYTKVQKLPKKGLPPKPFTKCTRDDDINVEEFIRVLLILGRSTRNKQRGKRLTKRYTQRPCQKLLTTARTLLEA